GVKFRDGYHEYAIERGGLRVFPRLVAAEHSTGRPRETFSSGIAALDALLGGGLDTGTSTLVMGPAGSGKSSLAMQYAIAAARRKQAAGVFCFEESRETLLARGDSLGMEMSRLEATGLVEVKQVDPA